MSMFLQLGTLKGIQGQRLERAEREVQKQVKAVQRASEIHLESLKKYEAFKAENNDAEARLLQSVMNKRAQKMTLAELPQRIEKIKREMAALKQESDTKEEAKEGERKQLTTMEGRAKRLKNKLEAFSILVDEEKHKIAVEEVAAEDAQIDEFVETRTWGAE